MTFSSPLTHTFTYLSEGLIVVVKRFDCSDFTDAFERSTSQPSGNITGIVFYGSLCLHTIYDSGNLPLGQLAFTPSCPVQYPLLDLTIHICSKVLYVPQAVSSK